MLKALLHALIRRSEREIDDNFAYMHAIVDISPSAFRKLLGLLNMAQFSRGVPAEARFAASLAATLAEDCGPCTQTVVNLALKSGVKQEIIAALLVRDLAASGEAAGLGFRFGDAVARSLPEIEEIDVAAERRWGKEGRLTLTYAAASARVYPAIKRGLGFAATCARVQLGNRDVIVNHAA